MLTQNEALARFRKPVTEPIKSPTGAERVDSFSRLATIVQTDGWFRLPIKFVMEEAAALSDREFFTALGLLLELENGPWRSSPSSIALVQGRDRRDIAKDLNSIVRADLGLARRSGVWTGDAFHTRHEQGAYVRFPRTWLLRLDRLPLPMSKQRILVILFSLWNPAEDSLPYLSCRLAAQALGISFGQASVRLEALPSWVGRGEILGRQAARRYGVDEWLKRLELAATDDLDKRRDETDEVEMRLPASSATKKPTRPIHTVEHVPDLAYQELDQDEEVRVRDFLKTRYESSLSTQNSLVRRTRELVEWLMARGHVPHGDFDVGAAMLDSIHFEQWVGSHYRDLERARPITKAEHKLRTHAVKTRAIQRARRWTKLSPMPLPETELEASRLGGTLRALLADAWKYAADKRKSPKLSGPDEG